MKTKNSLMDDEIKKLRKIDINFKNFRTKLKMKT